MNQTVVTEAQARQITGGRKPLAIMPYEEACQKLQEAIDFDEVSYFKDYATAWQALERIRKDSVALRKAKIYDIQVARRSGEIADKLFPRKARGKGSGAGCIPGPHAALKRELGYSDNEAKAARNLALMPPEKFDRLITDDLPNRRHIPTPVSLTRAAQQKLTYEISSFRSFCRRSDAREIAKSVEQKSADALRKCVVEIQEWLDTFEQCLPADK